MLALKACHTGAPAAAGMRPDHSIAGPAPTGVSLDSSFFKCLPPRQSPVATSFPPERMSLFLLQLMPSSPPLQLGGFSPPPPPWVHLPSSDGTGNPQLRFGRALHCPDVQVLKGRLSL